MQAEGIYFLGDLHSNVRPILKWNREVENSVLYCVGDLGIPNWDLFNLANRLSERGNKFYSIFGNHEHFKFTGQTYGDKENLTLLNDYSVIEINSKKILGIGGAISIDRVSRKLWSLKNPGQCSYYHTDEAFFLDEEKLREFRDIDIFITHTAPNYLIPDLRPGFVESYAQDDPTLLADIAKEREDTKRAIEILAESNDFWWGFGHYHKHVVGEFQGIKYRCLDIDEIYQYDH